MEAPRSSKIILFNDYLIVCFATSKDSHNLELDGLYFNFFKYFLKNNKKKKKKKKY